MKKESVAITLLGLQLIPQYAYAENNGYVEVKNNDDLDVLIFDDGNDESHQ